MSDIEIELVELAQEFHRLERFDDEEMLRTALAGGTPTERLLLACDVLDGLLRAVDELPHSLRQRLQALYQRCRRMREEWDGPHVTRSLDGT